MLKINIISIGKIKESYIKEGINEFKKRISKFANIFFIELKESSLDSVQALREEKEQIIKNMISGFNIIMSIKGQQFSSEELSLKIERIKQDHSQINFIIGSSHGLHLEIYNNADLELSFSKMTFPHQLFKLILTEQIYRALSISNNGKYHK